MNIIKQKTNSYFILLLISSLYSTIINIPDDYLNIQDGINSSVDGDTILVAPGTYQENLVIDKSIVLASHAIFDNLDDWVVYDDVFYEQWVVNNYHINNTTILGNNPVDLNFGSAILITSEDMCIEPEIIGFTIKNGLGTVVSKDNELKRIGGAVLADISNPLIHYNSFLENGGINVESGGAIQLTSSAEDWDFNDRFENTNYRCEVNEFRISNNFYNDNDAVYGNSISNRFHEQSFDMSGSVFDVLNCGSDFQSLTSSIWIDIEPDATVDFSDVEGNACSLTTSDIYVDSNIDLECFEEGCGFINNPFKTLTRALEMIFPSEDNPITIHLADGEYNVDTGESFPINMSSYTHIEGESELSTILNAQQFSGIFIFNNTENNIMMNLSLTGSDFNDANNFGANPIYSIFSNDIYLFNIAIFGNDVINEPYNCCTGGAIYSIFSKIEIENLNIQNNIAYAGGGIFAILSDIIISNSIISNNEAEYAGGVYVANDSEVIISNTVINNNSATNYGGILVSSSNLTLNNVDVSYNITSENGGGISSFIDPDSEGNSPNSYLSLNNVLISNNTAFNGAAMHLTNSSQKLNNVTIVDNISNGIDGIYISGSDNFEPEIEIQSSILWDDIPIELGDNVSMPNILYSTISNGYQGSSNQDPIFI